MFSPILALFFGFALLHTSMAIKCINQPDIKEMKNFRRQFPRGEKDDPKKFKQEWLRMINTRAEVDCAEVAHGYGQAEPTHCATTDDLSKCPGVLVHVALFGGVTPEEMRGIKWKECYFEEATVQTGVLSNKQWVTANACNDVENFGCRGCQVCNETDYCNADMEKGGWRSIEKMGNSTELEMNTTEATEKPEENGTTIGTNKEPGTTEDKGTTEIMVKSEETNGAGLPNGGAPQALFLLLLAIATGAFRRAAFC